MVLPVHSTPFNDEYITSYLYRFGQQYEIPINSMFSSEQIRDILMGEFGHLSYVTGIDTDIFKNALYGKYEGFIDNTNYISHGNEKKSYNYSTNHIKVCPLCLRENLYYKTEWTLNVSFACVKHKVLLIDKCKNCKEPIKKHSTAGFKIFPIGQCSKCGKEFQRFIPAKINNKWELNVQEVINSLSKVVKFKRGLTLNRKEFYTTIFTIITVLKYIKNDCSLLYGRNTLGLIPKIFLHGKYGDFERNYLLLLSAYRILENWPLGMPRLLSALCKMRKMARQYSYCNQCVIDNCKNAVCSNRWEYSAKMKKIYLNWVKSSKKKSFYKCCYNRTADYQERKFNCHHRNISHWDYPKCKIISGEVVNRL